MLANRPVLCYNNHKSYLISAGGVAEEEVRNNMGLRIKGTSGLGHKIAIITAVFALVAQPMYGFVASQVANAQDGTVAPVSTGEFTNPAATYYNKADYSGIAVDIRYANVSGLTGLEVTVERLSGGSVTKAAKPARIEAINAQNGASMSLTAPIIVQHGTLDEAREAASGSWVVPENNYWTKDTIPQNVVLTMTFADGTTKSTPALSIGERYANYADIAPETPIEVISANPAIGEVLKGVVPKGTLTAEVTGDDIADVRMFIYKEGDSNPTVGGKNGAPLMRYNNPPNVYSYRNSVLDTTTVADGFYQVEVVVKKSNGDTVIYNENHNAHRIEINNSAPVIKIDGINPDGKTYKAGASLNAHVSVSGGFESILLERDATSDNSWNYTGDGSDSRWFGLGWLRDGDYTLTATDKVGKKTVAEFAVDRTRPVVEANQVGGVVKESTLYNPTTFVIEANDDESNNARNDRQTGLDVISYSVWKYEPSNGAGPYGTGYHQVTSRSNKSSSTVTYNSSGLSDGEYFIAFGAGDKAGNTASGTNRIDFTVDRTAPQVANVSLNVVRGDVTSAAMNADGKLRVEFTTNELQAKGSQAFLGREARQGGELQTGRYHATLVNSEEGVYTYQILIDLNDRVLKDKTESNLYLRIRTNDALGNNTWHYHEDNDGQRYRLAVDNTAPVVGLVGPVGITNANSVTVSGWAHDDNMRYYACYITTNQPITAFGKGWTTGQEPKTGAANKQSLADSACVTTFGQKGTASSPANLGSFDVSGLPDGSYTIYLHAHDLLKNTNTVSTQFTIDRTAPVLEFIDIESAPDEDMANAYTITGTTSDPSTAVKLRINGQAHGASVESDGSWSLLVSLPIGSYEIIASSTDAAGNVADEVKIEYSWNVLGDGTNTPASTNKTSQGKDKSKTSAPGPASGISGIPPLPITPLRTPSNILAFLNSDVTDANASEREDGENAIAKAQPLSADSRVLAAQDTASESDAAGDEECGKLLGLCWYWWVAIAIGVAAIIYLVRSLRAGKGEDQPA